MLLACVCGGVGEVAAYGIFTLVSMLLIKFRGRFRNDKEV